MDIQVISRFVLKQRITFLVNRYEYFAQNQPADEPRQVAFVEQKRLKLREEITAYTSEARQEVLFSLKAERVLDVHGKYFVRDGQGKELGYLRKVFGKSLLRSTWEAYDASDRLLFTAQETNQFVAIFRRIAEMIPFVEIIAVFVPFHFEFLKDGVAIGSHRRQVSLRDEYVMTLEPAAANIDRRVVLAFGIALDALQAR